MFLLSIHESKRVRFGLLVLSIADIRNGQVDPIAPVRAVYLTLIYYVVLTEKGQE